MKKNNKGFTLAEMLIVVAIIGVLIAIVSSSISNALEKARESVDMANIRSAYSLLQAAALDDVSIPSADFKLKEASKYIGKVIKVTSSNDDKVPVGSYLTSIEIKQRKKGWQSLTTTKLTIGNFSWTPNQEIEGTNKYRCLYIAMDSEGNVVRIARGV